MTYLDVFFGFSRIANAFLLVENDSLGDGFGVVSFLLRNVRLDLCNDK